MSRSGSVITAVFWMVTSGLLSAAEWRIPDNAPLLSRWAKDVSPSNALREYPRPQMVRERWLNLDGLWDDAVTEKATDRPPSSYQGKISGDFKVPLYDVETESNGLLSYDRAVWKVDPAVVADAAGGGHRSGEATARGPSFTYRNPMDFSYPYFDGKEERTIRELRDPAIIREGDRYYLTFTVFPFTHSDRRSATKIDCNSSPGIMLYSSADLKHWKFERWLVKSSDLPNDCPYKHRFWAPEIHEIRDKFYLIFTADNWLKDDYNRGGKIGAYVAFVGVADNVTGPYRHITWLKGAGCDTTLFGDDDGKTYAIMPFGDQFIQEADLTGIERGDIKLIGPRKMIVRRSNSDVGKMTSPDYLEGPWMIKRDGRYILFTAAPYRETKKAASAPDLAQGYWVGAAVADNVWGPYTKQPQVFLGGHVAAFAGPDGQPWFCYRGESGGNSQGRLCIDPIEFHADDSIQPFEPSTGPRSVDVIR